jgi:hypothetical protein
MHGQLTLIFFIILVFSGTVSADCRYQSSAHRVALLELYTSEGCSSCPPADRWLSRLDDQGLKPDRVVPLSLHVDYWNYIGWRDPYSNRRYTQRQRKIARQNRLGTIYTPQLVLQGRDFRSWRSVSLAHLLESVNQEPAGADITLQVVPQAAREYAMSVTAKLRHPGRGRLFVAIYENQLSSNVTAGENDGRLLQHDYVVRRLYGPVQISESASTHPDFKQRFQLDDNWQENSLGIAAFVEQANGEILQAMAAPLICVK